MSLITAVYVPTGIALSGDSRTTGTSTQTVVDPTSPTKTTVLQKDILLSDATEKVFLVDGRFGVGTYGAALVKRLPIAHYVAQLQASPGRQSAADTASLAQELLNYFRALQPIPASHFLVVGYDAAVPSVIGVDVSANRIERFNVDPLSASIQYGARWGGDSAIVGRLVSNTTFAFDVMNVQDAVDFSRHLVRSTIDQLRFEPRFPTVGGPIDTLVVTPSEAKFLVRKALHCD